MKVEWDEGKDRVNRVLIDESTAPDSARRVNCSHLVSTILIFDDEHSVMEDRFIAIGSIRRGLVLVVWTERDEDTLRIISARWATVREQSMYEDHLRRLL